jgi:DTW domain-containing protein YfiP
MKALRKRKTKDPCDVCKLHKDRCICEYIPSLNLKTKISLIIHAKELKRTTNTGSLAIRALVNSEMRVRGLNHDALDLTDLLSDEYRTLLFYPSKDAIELNHELVGLSPKPIQLIVPDGNWRQASKVHYRHHELKDIQRVMISTAGATQGHLRAENTEHGMATLHAISLALGIIEGAEIQSQLMRLYEMKLEQTLKGRVV